MNIENVAALAKQMQSLGFEEAGGLLLKRVCFSPASFYLLQTIVKAEGQLAFSFFFEKQTPDDSYVLKYYDAALQTEYFIGATPSDNSMGAELEKQMAAIDWKKAFDLDSPKAFSAENKSTWEFEARIKSVIDNIRQMEKAENGKAIANGLKLKYWTATSYNQLFPTIAPMKTKSDISQRFYFSESGSGITVDEAYRFLQNKWLEKQIQQRKKQTEGTEQSESKNGNGSSGGSLLRKRSMNHSGKRNNRKIKTD